jgi:hypothetical protein
VSASATGEKAKPTKKERKAQKLAAVGVLKQIVKKPEIVEVGVNIICLILFEEFLCG